MLPDGVDVTEARAGSYAVTGALTPADLAAITAWWAAARDHAQLPEP